MAVNGGHAGTKKGPNWGHVNKHKQLRGIVPEMGGGQIVYVFPFSWGKKETHKQNSQEISGKGRESPGTVPGQSRENFVYVFACLLVFSPALN